MDVLELFFTYEKHSDGTLMRLTRIPEANSPIKGIVVVHVGLQLNILQLP